MTVKYIVSQGMVIIAMLCLGATYLVKDKKKIVILGFFYNTFYGLQYLLLNAMTGVAMNVVSIIRNIWFYRNEKLKKKNGIGVLIGTIILILILGQASYQNIYTAVPMLATSLYTYSVWQDNVKVYRWLALPMSFLWINYAFYNKSIFGFICESILLVIEIIGLIRINHDFKSKKRREVNNMEKSKVYFCKEINSDNLIKMYEVLNKHLNGKVGVKISTGEPGGHNFLNPQLIEPLVSKLNGTIIECCTAYGRKRQDPIDHWEAIKNHGFYDIAPCDIMDEFGEFEIKVENGFHLSKNIVGEHLKNYDSILMLSHYKGHQMAGMGGALKNMSIGIASHNGKLNIHSAGKTTNQEECWSNLPMQDHFLESMADACKSIINYMGKDNIIYINVLNNLSIDCDCSSNPAEPKMKDIGIMASTDPVALDKACYDAIINSSDEGKTDLVNRMLDKHAIHIVEASFKHGLGNLEYEIIEIND